MTKQQNCIRTVVLLAAFVTPYLLLAFTAGDRPAFIYGGLTIVNAYVFVRLGNSNTGATLPKQDPDEAPNRDDFYRLLEWLSNQP